MRPDDCKDMGIMTVKKRKRRQVFFEGIDVASCLPSHIEYGTLPLLLHKSTWPQFSSVFQLNADGVRNLLSGVRKTRNDLAHFHGEISASQRDQLHFCIEWLERQRQVILDAFHFSAEVSEPQQVERTSPLPGPTEESMAEEIAPIEEPLRQVIVAMPRSLSGCSNNLHERKRSL